MWPCGSTRAAPANRRARASRGRYQESLDFYDAIEWAASSPGAPARSGSPASPISPSINGSSPTTSRPPLKAIIPWEGFADLYRDALFHGGILNQFMTNWFVTHLAHHLIGRAYREQPRHAGRPTRCGTGCATISTTAPSAASRRSGTGSPCRCSRPATGRAWACTCAATPKPSCAPPSPHKKLRMHSGTHVHPFYTEDGRRDQLRFFDYWLKGIDNGVMDEPPVKLAIRQGGGEVEWRHEQEWPLARTQWTKLYLDLSHRRRARPPTPARCSPPIRRRPARAPISPAGSSKGGSASASSTFLASGAMQAGMGISLDTAPLAQDTEITGPVAAVLWVSSSTEDMDLFLTLRNIDPDGNDVWEAGQQGQQVPVAKGWLRVSHRELDPRPLAALSALPPAQAPPASHAGRDRAGAGRDLADLDGVQARPPPPARHPAARRRRQPCTTRTIMPTTTAAPTPSTPAARRNPICCCR